ncbi:hypothetical protein C2G38_2211019 [Gigaspora rosea]|uniref:Uncharacterized protein n=1 Tax=Gigaspora rosea TaxID=44941 RepID=A0A397UEU9_9GLOM|nr:hypothetical protein C2G38_2211019 [Gigaspora rosea]
MEHRCYMADPLPSVQHIKKYFTIPDHSANVTSLSESEISNEQSLRRGRQGWPAFDEVWNNVFRCECNEYGLYYNLFTLKEI